MADGALVAERYSELARLAKILESSKPPPRALVYASYSDTDDEKLLVVPSSKAFDEREAYRVLSLEIAKARKDLPSIDVSDVRIVPESDPYIRGLASLFRADEFSTISISKSFLNGVYIEHAVVFRLAL